MLRTSILVVEDEAIVSKDIQQSLVKLGYSISGASSTGYDAVALAESEEPDLVLMDIMLKGTMSGIEAAKIIRQKLAIPIIYLTAYADEVTLKKARLAEPFGYIIKPFKEIDLQTSIEMAVFKNRKEIERAQSFSHVGSSYSASGESFFIRTKGSVLKIRINDVCYIEALKDYAQIITNNNQYIIHATMKEIEKKLEFSPLIRVHRSYFVHLEKIKAIEHHHIVLEDSEVMIPIGPHYRQILQQKLRLL